MRNPFVQLCDDILRENAKGMEQAPDPCLTTIAAAATKETVLAVMDHAKIHGEQELERLLAQANRRQYLRFKMYVMKMEQTGARDMATEPAEITEVIESGFTDQVDAAELAVLFSLLPMLAAQVDEKAGEITVGRSFYATARQLLSELLGWHFPGVSLPTDDAGSGQTAETTSPAPALDGGSTEAPDLTRIGDCPDFGAAMEDEK